MKQIRIIKFLPYFPPHTGGLESHVQERSKRRVKKGYGEVMNIVPCIGQEGIMNNEEGKIMEVKYIYYKGKKVGYKKEGYQVLVYPAFDLIPTFPFPKFRTRDFRRVMKLAKRFHADILNTHTRFFLTSLLGGIFAKCTRTKWIHIEHGVDYVKLISKLKSLLAYLYDQAIGRWIFRCSNGLIGISYGCKRFMHKFTKKHIDVVHRGMDLPEGMLNVECGMLNDMKGNIEKGTVRIVFVGRLVKLKGVDLLVNVVKKLLDVGDRHIHLDIVGDGEERKNLEKQVHDLSLSHHVLFLGFQEKDKIMKDILPHMHIVVNPSYQEGLPTSVLEGLLCGCVVVATDVGGTPEISDQNDLILIKPRDEKSLYVGLEKAIENYKKIVGLSAESVRRTFDWEITIEKYHRLYQNIVDA